MIPQVEAGERKKFVIIISILKSIRSNASGGRYDDRSTRAAVNAVVKGVAADLAPRGIIAVPLHPGCVRTDIGGPRAGIDVATSAAGPTRVMEGLTPRQSGTRLNDQGIELPW